MSEREWRAIVSFFQEQANGHEQFDLLYQISMAQAKTMLYEMHRWETGRIHALENGDDSPQTATYREFIALLAEFKPHVSPAGIDYPAYRKLIKGLLFGTPFQWRVIRQFPAFAASVGMEWNNQTFDALMRALEMAVKKVARIHASVLVLQAHVLSITQDDAHVFCRESQLKDEMNNIWNLIEKFYSAFGFDSLTPRFSRRDDDPKFKGNIEQTRITASFKDGILKITIPKTSNKNKTKLIRIKSE
jgi:hypothetical protein